MGSGYWSAATLRRVRRAVPLIAVVSLAGAGVAHADTFKWSGPVAFGNSNDRIAGLACANSAQCAVVGSPGSAAIFNPVAPGTLVLTPVNESQGKPAGTLGPLLCSATECVTLLVHQALSFSTSGPSVSTPVTIDSNYGQMTAGTCAPSGLCMAVDGSGGLVTFDPSDLAAASGPTQIDPTGASKDTLLGVSCPSSSQCTAVDFGGSEVTFNPNSPGAGVTHAQIGPGLYGVSCPATTQCTASAGSGVVVTFNPDAVPVTHSQTTIDSQAGVDTDLGGVSCPSLGQCTVIDGGGRELTFDPQSPSSPAPVPTELTPGLAGVDCTSNDECLVWTTEGIFVGQTSGSGALGGGGGGGPNKNAEQQQALGAACGSISGEADGTVLSEGGYNMGLNIDEAGNVTVTVTGVGGGISTVTYSNTVTTLAFDDGGGVNSIAVGGSNGSVATYTGNGNSLSGSGGTSATLSGAGHAAADPGGGPPGVWASGLAADPLSAACSGAASIASVRPAAQLQPDAAHRRAKLCVRKHKRARPKCTTFKAASSEPIASATESFTTTGPAHVRVPLTRAGRLELAAARALDAAYKRKHKHAHSLPALKLAITVGFAPAG